MKKKALAAVILAMSLFAAGCGEEGDDTASQPAQLEPQPIVSTTPTPAPTPDVTPEPEPTEQVITERVERMV